jgi:hypothetical protein
MFYERTLFLSGIFSCRTLYRVKIIRYCGSLRENVIYMHFCFALIHRCCNANYANKVKLRAVRVIP